MAEPTPLRRQGDNFPPSDTDALRTELAEKYGPLLRRFVELEAACGDVPKVIQSDAVAQKVVDFVAQQIRPLETEARAAHKNEKAPHLALGKVVDEFFLRRLDRLKLAVARAEAPAAAYYDKKKAAQRAQEAEDRRAAARKAQEAQAEAQRLKAQAAVKSAAGDTTAAVALAADAEAATERAQDAERAAAAAPAPVRILGDYGATGFAKTRWVFDIEDLEALPDGFWTPDEDAIQAVIDETVAATGKPPDIPGVRVYQTDRFVIRRC